MIEDVRSAIKNAEAILVFAGAGMSVDSDLPTYRDKEGFWNDYPLYRGIKKDYVAMASAYGFLSNPHFAWGFFAHQYSLYKNATPHEGYKKLLEILLEKKNYFVVTTNVDGLFLKAGFPKDQLHEAHGSIHRLQCIRTCQRKSWNIETLGTEIDYSTMNALDPLPFCSFCGSVSRPNIFMFGDTDDSYVWEESQESARRYIEWRQKNNHKKIVILEIGVGAEGLKRHVQKYYDELPSSTLIRINPESDNSHSADAYHISLRVKDTLCAISESCEYLSLSQK